jgi:hypothetical protein
MIKSTYEWYFDDHMFKMTKEWPEEWLEKTKSMRHEIRDPAQWDYFISHEPYKKEFIDFLEDLQDVGFEKLDLSEPKMMLEYMLSFVQNLEYVPDPLEYPKYPTEMIIDAGGDCEDSALLFGAIANVLGWGCGLVIWHDHADLGIAALPGEFEGTFFTKQKIRYYYVHCNAPGYKIGQYNGKFGDNPAIYHLNHIYPKKRKE